MDSLYEHLNQAYILTTFKKDSWITAAMQNQELT